MPRLAELSREERQTMQAKARATKAANHAARQASTLRRDFLDADHWEELARARGLRLPPWGAPCTLSAMRTWLHKAGLSQSKYEAHQGKLAAFTERNRTWPLRAWAGLVLEYQEVKDERQYTQAG